MAVMKAVFLLAVGAAVASGATMSLAAPPAAAEQLPCGDRATILAALKESYTEQPVAAGLDAYGRMMEVLASPDTGTWTILVTTAGGTTCLVASGIAWEAQPIQIAGPVA